MKQGEQRGRCKILTCKKRLETSYKVDLCCIGCPDYERCDDRCLNSHDVCKCFIESK